MLLENLTLLCDRGDQYRAEFASFLGSKELSKTEHDNVLESLCKLLMQPECAKDVAECFPQLLLVLLSLAIEVDHSNNSDSVDPECCHRLNSVILGKLIRINPDVLGFTLKYFEVNSAPFENLTNSLSRPSKRHRPNQNRYVSVVSDYDIVLACYNILRAATDHFKHKWNWSKFYKFLLSNDNKVKWVALKCIAIVLDMSEALRLACAKSLVEDYQSFLIDYEHTRVSPISPVSDNSLKEVNEIVKDVPTVASVAGVLLPVLHRNRPKTHHNLIPVPSMEENLRSLALAVASRKCVCLQGPVGCGKTALIEYLAEITGHGTENFTKVQLGDQTDSKMLLGTYRCTDIPGEFIWQPGVLTQAVTAGKWLLLEDIDSAALDVASVLSNLIETGTLSVPGYRDIIYVKSGFQLFVTQRLITSASGVHRQPSGASNLLEKNWLRVNMEPLSRDELVTVVQTLFPVLNTIATRMVDVFLLFSMGHHGTDDGSRESLALKTGRLTSTRDLMKWCSRAIKDFMVSSPESALKIFQDAIDIFCCSVPDQGQRLNLAIAIGHTLGIVKTKAQYFCHTHKPSIILQPDFLIGGRSKVPRKRKHYAQLDNVKLNFSFTRPSACLLERIASCVAQKEPVLLVGETGTGKTSSVQYLARSTGHKLVVINMNQQSESADLLGGYKPVDFKFLVTPIREEFEMLFRSYYAVEPNRKFLEHVALCYKQHKWKTLVQLMIHSTNAAVKRLRNKMSEYQSGVHGSIGKRRSLVSIDGGNKNEGDCESKLEMLTRWNKLALKLEKLSSQVRTQYSLAFAFIEGSLIKALQEGYWVLLDEINLASAETLECLSGLLEGSSGSLSLLERGDKESIKRHSDFTIFACMNPATDIGKKELPVGLRNRFTEFYVDELTEQSDLQLLVGSYLGELNLPTVKQEAIVKFYLNVRKEAMVSLFDGTAHKPHYSLRTLCRALSVAASNPCSATLRSLYEAFCLSFLTQLDHNSYPVVQGMIVRAILDSKTAKGILSAPIPKPRSDQDDDYINFEGYWVVRGKMTPETPKNYILTASVRRNLKDLVRVVSIGKIPVLLQGDTSVGKTSLITYLAKASGHTCVRINNHEHTDLQEYVGSYVADETGKLVFREGVLVEAMRKGHWIILDELNLAPSDVLEALNRVLDDNRELFIPETQQTVKAHANFMLFATQNPPGLYGGRKVLSRAFRNRFVELHFDEIPSNELQTILHERCHMPESYCKQIINVMTDLQIRRKNTAAFAGKQGFITLRDLFRWGERYRLAPDVGQKLYDWSQHLADEGYLVLAAKVRKPEEADEIRQVIKKHLKRDVDPDTLFTLNERTSSVTRHILEEIFSKGAPRFEHIVWTYHMRRMAVLVKKSCEFREPVLLVGETGGGKTTICQLIAVMSGQKLYSVNCHMHTESSDFLGNLRPVREHSDLENQKLFEWVDGPLIESMQKGGIFLADEISLADDSVLERLNSLLEPERSLLLAEKGIDSSDESDSVIVANENFLFIGTMNPGGDYGKKELSPALRNRFTEIWCEGCTKRSDLQEIIEHNLSRTLEADAGVIARSMLEFVDWLSSSEVGKRFTVSIRDVLTWVKFINVCTSKRGNFPKLNIGDAYYHGACLTYIDSLGSGLTGMESSGKLQLFRKNALSFLKSQVEGPLGSKLSADMAMETDTIIAKRADESFGIEPFFIPKGPGIITEDESFTFIAPTTGSNTLKLLRGLQLAKPLLLEGSPGVGKTSLVSALAKASGNTLLRINLSDQTDVSDLFGADLPVEGGQGGEFAWRDGPFLRALRAGHWILLDELNLASQSVLEGLNACLDHRGEVYIPELAKTFSVEPGTKLFACQNPLRQGGARRGLPKSFLNRFTQVFIDALTDNDLKFITVAQFKQLPTDLISKMVDFNTKLSSEAGVTWGYQGSPWEMNLRDITRWCEATVQSCQPLPDEDCYYNPGRWVELIYIDRMRTLEDKQKVRELYAELFPVEKYPLPPSQPLIHLTETNLYLGDVTLTRTNSSIYTDSSLLLLRDQVATLKSLAQCVKMNWMSILVGGSGVGKSSVVRILAQLAGRKLKSIAVNSAMDTTEILGGFEQTDYNRHLEQIFEQVENLLKDICKKKISKESLKDIETHQSYLEQIRNLSQDAEDSTTMSAESGLFLKKCKELSSRVNAMEKLEPSMESELKKIEFKLHKLSLFVEQDKSLNAGGKFEWVDSVLVKCLQEGSWLLVDQVNLCSPAVLDRLNGLLEPAGVLSIGERGVDNSGNIVTVKPHKDFRLFLTMDPRYGEISRAMRNRGVEICMLGHGGNSHENLIDLKSMLYDSGLTRSSYQNTLIEIHQHVVNDSFTVDKLSVIQLVQAAFLISQQISRGFPVKEAFRTACIDVYVKARSLGHSQIKDRLISRIDETLNNFTVDNQSNDVYLDLDAVTLNVNNLQDNSKLTLIRQQGSLLSAIVNRYKFLLKSSTESTDDSALTTEFLNEFFQLENIHEFTLRVELLEILPYLLLSFYETSSLDNVNLRNQWLAKILIDEEALEKFNAKSASLAKEISTFNFHSVVNTLPWDLAQVPGVSTDVSKFENISDSNRLALLLYLEALGIKDGKLLETLNTSKNEKIMSIIQYSNAVYYGMLTSQLNDQPLITNFVIFLAQLDKCIYLILKDAAVKVDNKRYVEIRRNLKWRARFYKLGEFTLIDKLKKSSSRYENLDQISWLLRVHYKWLIKFLENIFQLSKDLALRDECSIEIDSLRAMITEINKSLITVQDRFRKLSRKIKLYLDLPQPYSSEEVLSVYKILKNVSNNFSTWKDRQAGNKLKQELKIACLQFEEILEARSKAITLWHDIYLGKELNDAALSTTSEIVQHCEGNYLSLRNSVEISQVVARVHDINEKELTLMAARVQLWPIYEYMFLILTASLQKRVSEKMLNNEMDMNRTSCLFPKFAEIPSIPINLLAVLNAILIKIDNPIERNQLMPELFIWLTRFAHSSYAVKGSNRLLHWNGIIEEDIEKFMVASDDTEVEYPIEGPILVNLISELILDKTSSAREQSVLAMATLGTYRARINQLRILNEILWQNSASLNSEQYNYALNDIGTLKYHLSVFLSATDKMEKMDKGAVSIVMGKIESEVIDKKNDLISRLERDYLEPLAELGELSAKLGAMEKIKDDILHRGKAWTLLGYLQVFLFGNVGHIDPVLKMGLRQRYLEEDIVDCKSTIYIALLNSRILGDDLDSRNQHPRILEMKNSLRNLLEEKDDLKSFSKVNRSPSEFTALAKETASFRNTLGSYDVVRNHVERLTDVIARLQKEPNGLRVRMAEDATRQAEMWQESLERFSEQIENKFLPGYPDIVLPLLSSVTQLKHGIRILANETKKLISLARTSLGSYTVESLLYNLVRFPSIGPEQTNLLELVDLCTSPATRELINKNLNAGNVFASLQEQFRIMKSGLCELYNHIALGKELSRPMWSKLNKLLQQIVLIWRQQQAELEKREAEKESLYKNQAQIKGESLTDEEEIKQELRNLFPTYRDADFSDIDSIDKPSLEQREELAEETERFEALITEDDVKEVQEMHSSIVVSFTRSQWLKNSSTISGSNYMKPLIQRYKTFGLLLDNVNPALTADLTPKLYTSLNLLTAVTASLSQGTSIDPDNEDKTNIQMKQRKSYDFYKDSNVEESNQCLLLLERIINRVDELLLEWPEHPTLKSIKIISQRVYSFPVTSSVSRFLTGLELLLVKMKEWEENAHSGVSLLEYSLSLTQQIISWRKLELACWKDCLNVSQEHLRSQTSKWWFFLYALIECYITKPSSQMTNDTESEVTGDADKEEPITPKKLIESLELFVNQSNLVEFNTRLDLLLTFHCHVYHLNPSQEREELLAILWNVYHYYDQFRNNVNGKINTLKAPIEKKLKDYVKIARWNDISYWAIKETVEKTHRALHKFIKEFETGLKESVAGCLIIKPLPYNAEADKGIWDRQSERIATINPQHFILPKITEEQYNLDSGSTKTDLISRADKLLNKSRKLCNETILMSSYPGLRTGLEQLIEDSMDRSVHLRNLEVDRTLPKPKQKSQAKSILQQKKMALADYFKRLTRIGVSYRTGVLTWKNKRDTIIDLTVPPVNLFASAQQLKIKKIDEQMLTEWEGCEKYYYRSLVEINALNALLTSNNTDLGLQNMERCKGYSAHVMLMAHKQKRTLADAYNHFILLRTHLENLKNSRYDDYTPKQDDLKGSVDQFKQLMITVQSGLEQVQLYLQACPAVNDSELCNEILSLDTDDVPIIVARKGDPVWLEADNLIRDSLMLLQTTAKKFIGACAQLEVVVKVDNSYSKQSTSLTSFHFKMLMEFCKVLENVKASICQLGKVFGSERNVTHPLLDNIYFFMTEIEQGITKFQQLSTASCDTNEFGVNEIPGKFEANLEKLMNTLLLAIQKKYKDSIAEVDILEERDNEEKEIEKNEEKKDDEYEDDEENGLREKLIESLDKDIRELKLREISQQLNEILLMIQDVDSYTANRCNRLLGKCLPLLEQYLLLSQFFLNEQVASFRVTCKILHLQLNVFLDLASNGFCVPKDLDLEEGDANGEQEGVDKGGMGLGDGEGQKDVSERIESEDQLEDARPAGQEKEEPVDKDCKEEDKGIEMSEDFDSKLQDLEKNEDDEDNSEKEDEEEDLDKQMGETEQGADKLDEEIWGADEDEAENENDETEENKEETGKGEQTGEKEMGAKDERNDGKNEEEEREEQGQQEEQKKEINEMEEPETNEDQIDPYHGKHQPEPEPEPMDLPEDMNLDDEEGKEDNPAGEDNPFDIDEMKDAKPPPEKEEVENTDEDKKDDKLPEDSSDEENEDTREDIKDLDNKEDKMEEEASESDKQTATQAPEEDNKDQEDETDKNAEEDKEREEEKATPSADDGSKETDAAEQAENKQDGSRDKIANQSEDKEQQEASEENTQDDNNDKGTGQAQSEQQDSGHSGSSMQNSVPMAERPQEDKQKDKRKNPGKSDENRSLLDRIEPDKKKQKMIHAEDEMPQDDNQEEGERRTEDGEADMCQHVKQTEKFDDYAQDAATEEQSKQQVANREDEKEDEEKDENMDIDMHQDEEEEMNKEEEAAVKQNPEKMPKNDDKKEKNKSNEKGNNAEEGQMETVVEVEGDITETLRVDRGDESAFFTNIIDTEENLLTVKQIERKRLEVEKMLSQWTNIPPTEEATVAWNCLSAVTDAAARDLSEKLRLVLEPTQASRLKGDYRTGRRINMRKIIPYIASQFRKDKIWLRRTKPSKRDYQIVLALDDSSSMADNHSKELAFESLSLISKAMTYLEVGQLCVISFGEEPNVLHPLGEPFTEQSGSRLMQEMRFEQKKTMMGQLVDFTVDMFDSQPTSSDNAKLLVVLSDGRGVFSEGTDRVNRAVRRAKLADIFLVFIIVDNPVNKDSILDIRMPMFQGGKLLGIRSYMDSFPFPFYMILRDINALPGVLSDALRQWFEVVGKIDS
ncbi:midasin [Cephus cinctus]|uniref:Midasin n=1 Tax=Cephus cinctus TaxID=211228 RepID=A0AAJ7C915_CEPCN|nr:midasin [Cephus cinctus]